MIGLARRANHILPKRVGSLIRPAQSVFSRRPTNCLVVVAAFSLFSAWHLTVAFEGQVFYSLASKHGVEPHVPIFGAMGSLVVGMLACGLLVRSLRSARKVILWSVASCALGSTVFLTRPSTLWVAFLLTGSFLMGLCIACWGHYLVGFTAPHDRLETVAQGLIYSNVLMLLIDVVTVNISPYSGLALAVSCLVGAFVLFGRPLGKIAPAESPLPSTGHVLAPNAVAKPLLLLCLFIIVITVNSGLMYQVIGPAYSHHVGLSSWYWVVPYIAALYIMKKSMRDSNKGHVLYAAAAMMGLAFLAFMVLDRSVGSYLVVDTLLLGACGVYDLFWWSVLAEMLGLGANPGAVLGVGLSANVLGVLIGGVVGNKVLQGVALTTNTSVLALAILFISVATLPWLQNMLSLVLRGHAFLAMFDQAFPGASQEKRDEVLDKIAETSRLTGREKEVAHLLLQGQTYKAIAGSLTVSENTVKYHVKNIYSKVNVQNKIELLNLVADRPKS